MTIPPTGTNPRRVLDCMRNMRFCTVPTLAKMLSDIARPAIQHILDDEVSNGNLVKRGTQYRFTDLAVERFNQEESRNQAELLANNKPLCSSRYINTKGTRPSSDWSRDVFKSKHV